MALIHITITTRPIFSIDDSKRVNNRGAVAINDLATRLPTLLTIGQKSLILEHKVTLKESDVTIEFDEFDRRDINVPDVRIVLDFAHELTETKRAIVHSNVIELIKTWVSKYGGGVTLDLLVECSWSTRESFRFQTEPIAARVS